MEDKKTDYEILRSFAKGKDFVEIYSIFDDVSKRNPLGDSRVDIALKDSDELGKLLDIDDDDIWFAQVILNPYNDYEFNDYSSFYEDFKEGYGLYDYLDEENINLLKDRSKLHPEQFFWWEFVDHNPDLFVSPDDVLKFLQTSIR